MSIPVLAAVAVFCCYITGWAAALSCYPPFVYSVLDAYCTYNSPQNAWGFYLKDAPRWLFWMWGSTILILSTIYSWATVAFGMRFSNLTNRVGGVGDELGRQIG